MKSLLLFAFVLLATCSFSQTTTDDDLKGIWKTNIQPIIDLDETKIMERTQFPLDGEWPMIIELEQGTKEDFQSNIEKIFSQEVRDALGTMDYNKLSVMGDDTWTIVTLLIDLTTEVDGVTVESMMAFELEFVDDMWKLTSINLIG